MGGGRATNAVPHLFLSLHIGNAAAAAAADTATTGAGADNGAQKAMTAFQADPDQFCANDAVKLAVEIALSQLCPDDGGDESLIAREAAYTASCCKSFLAVIQNSSNKAFRDEALEHLGLDESCKFFLQHTESRHVQWPLVDSSNHHIRFRN